MDLGVGIYSVSSPHDKNKPHTVSEVNHKWGMKKKERKAGTMEPRSRRDTDPEPRAPVWLGCVLSPGGELGV